MESENNSNYELSQEERYRFQFGTELENYILDSQKEGFDGTIFDYPLEFNMPNDRLVVLPMSVRPIYHCHGFTSLFKVLESSVKQKESFICYDYIQETMSENTEMYDFLVGYQDYKYGENK